MITRRLAVADLGVTMFETSLKSADGYDIAAELTRPERCELLADERRRAVLDSLDGQSTVELEPLARSVAASGDGVVTDDAVERLKRMLHHVHLPKMDDVGVVDYDPDESLVVTADTP